MHHDRRNVTGSAQERNPNHKLSKKQKDQLYITMALGDAFAFGTHLGHHGVKSNAKSTNIYDMQSVEDLILRQRSLFFGLQWGSIFISSSRRIFWRHHACHVGSTCAKCIVLPLKKRRAEWPLMFKDESAHSIP